METTIVLKPNQLTEAIKEEILVWKEAGYFENCSS